MKIKNYYVAILLVAFWPVNMWADGYNGYFAAVVQATNGLTLGISLVNANGLNSTERPIDLDFKSPANTNSRLFIPKEEYLVRLQLYDSNNVPITKTELGSKYGQNFDDIYWDIKKFAKSPHSPTLASEKWSWGYSLPKISDLFVIKTTGKYRLQFDVQVMLYFLDVSKKHTNQILRFPPVEITVTKPEPPAIKNN